MSEQIRIVLVEDNKVFREALELLLGLRSDLLVVATVADGEEAVPACKEHHPQVALMDYRLPGLDGVEATRALKAACPEVARLDLAMPNKHCLLINLAPFGLENDNEVFVPTDEPHGQIEVTVARDD